MISYELYFQIRFLHQEHGLNFAQIARELDLDEETVAWKHCWWKAATGARQHTRIAWQEVFVARELKEPHGQLEKLWLVVDWPKGAKEPYHCYLAHFCCVARYLRKRDTRYLREWCEKLRSESERVFLGWRPVR